MNNKIKFDAILDNVSCRVAAAIIIVWGALYLYFLSSSCTPSSLYDYEDELSIKEKALQMSVIGNSLLNKDPLELIKVYKLRANNRLCRADGAAAERDMAAALRLAQNKCPSQYELAANLYLGAANIDRDINEFDKARINHSTSLSCLKQIPLSIEYKTSTLKIAAINYNNLGILSFLTGQKTEDQLEREKCYIVARNYFARAKEIMYLLFPKQLEDFQYKIDQNLDNCLLEMQYGD